MSIMVEWETTKNRQMFKGSSLQGYVRTTYDQLEELLGPPSYLGSSDGKVHCEWLIVVEDHIPISVYDYKNEYTPLDEYEWHIGGYGNHATIFFNLIADQEGKDMHAYDWRTSVRF